MTVIVQRAAIIAALSLATLAALAYGMPDGIVAALPVIDAGPAGSVIWD